MRRYAWLSTIVVVTSVLTGGSSLVSGGEPIAETAFKALPVDEQRELIVEALKRRLDVENAKYAVTQRGEVRSFDGKTPGQLVVTLVGSHYRSFRRDGNYKVDTERGTESVDKPTHFASSGYKPSDGVSRTTLRFSNGPRQFGRIDTVPPRSDQSDRYAYWFDGTHNAEAEYFIRYLVDHASELKVDSIPSSDRVKVVVPWQPFGVSRSIGFREVTLAIDKGFMPVSGRARWEEGPEWRLEEFEVTKDRAVGEMWMPTGIREVIAASTLPGKCNVWELDVSTVELGTVAPAEVEVVFPPGMEVVDAIEGVSYRVETDGARGELKPLIGSRRVKSAR